LSLDEMKALTGDSGLTIASTDTDVNLPAANESTYQPVDCIGTFLAGTPPPYQGTNYRQFYEPVQQNETTLLQVVQAVASFDDAAAAQRALSGYVAQWSRCAGTTLTRHFSQTGGTAAITLGGPEDGGDGITTMVNHQIRNQRPFFRAIAAKGNVLVDIQDSGGAEVPGQAIEVIKRILARIPG
jgi:FlaG/FlaF family flagellin (archaellin)